MILPTYYTTYIVCFFVEVIAVDLSVGYNNKLKVWLRMIRNYLSLSFSFFLTLSSVNLSRYALFGVCNVIIAWKFHM